VSIGRRLIDLARAELNSLLDRAARTDDDDDGAPRDRSHDHDDDGFGGEPLGRLSDKELEEELERRRQARQEAERAARGPRRGDATASSAAGGRRRPEFRRGMPEDDDVPIRRAYATLEVPYGADFEAVRRSYRALMRKYHPDLHTATPEKQKAANELTQKLTDSYKLLEKRLRK
jgi:DnaJ-domain-containing protein 1